MSYLWTNSVLNTGTGAGAKAGRQFPLLLRKGGGAVSFYPPLPPPVSRARLRETVYGRANSYSGRQFSFKPEKKNEIAEFLLKKKPRRYN